MKPLLTKVLVVCLIALICGAAAGLLFSLFFYGMLPEHMRAEVYVSDTPARVRLRFWIAFAAGAILGAVWSYRMVKGMDLR